MSIAGKATCGGRKDVSFNRLYSYGATHVSVHIDTYAVSS